VRLDFCLVAIFEIVNITAVEEFYFGMYESHVLDYHIMDGYKNGKNLKNWQLEVVGKRSMNLAASVTVLELLILMKERFHCFLFVWSFLINRLLMKVRIHNLIITYKKFHISLANPFSCNIQRKRKSIIFSLILTHSS
jgi:hypothetical protein